MTRRCKKCKSWSFPFGWNYTVMFCQLWWIGNHSYWKHECPKCGGQEYDPELIKEKKTVWIVSKTHFYIKGVFSNKKSAMKLVKELQKDEMDNTYIEEHEVVEDKQ